MNPPVSYRIEHGSMGEVRVPRVALYGAQPQRAAENFRISGLRMPRRLIHTLGLIMACAAETNGGLERLDSTVAAATTASALEVANGVHDDHFPVAVFQTGRPGSSIMPGKLNPLIPEAVAMASVQILGNDAAIAMAGQSGQFQLNTMLPLIAYNLLRNIELLASSARVLNEKTLAGFTINEPVSRPRWTGTRCW